VSFLEIVGLNIRLFFKRSNMEHSLPSK